jgi:hypothetical protein
MLSEARKTLLAVPGQRMTIPDHPPHAQPVGYAALVERRQLRVLPHYRWSFVATRGAARELADGRVVLRSNIAEPSAMGDLQHLLFALRYDGVNLEICDAYFAARTREEFEHELAQLIKDRPTGKYVRRLWFLYEWLTDRKLPVPDATQGTYVPLLDPEIYFVGPGRPSRRHRVHDNLFGNVQFCPLVRRTAALESESAQALRTSLDQMVAQYEPGVFARAIAYLYTKETMSSFAIERESPSPQKAERFAQLLTRLEAIEPWSETNLAAIQARIVDERFAESEYRDLQNYVGESIDLTRQHVHFVPPCPKDVRSMMEGLNRAAKGMEAAAPGGIDAVIWAACVSFGFVFIHPFVDGNGRLHRFLIHYVLAKAGVTPPKVVAPVSAVMLSRRREYEALLESFSRPLMELIDYQLAPDAGLSVRGDTARHYRYIDYTKMAEALYRWLEQAVREELPAELDFLVRLRRTREAMSCVVDLPDRLADLFVKVCLQNGGALSATKRASHFAMLSDVEVGGLEGAIRENMPARFSSRA